MTLTIIALVAYGLAMTGWGLYWRAEAEDLMDEVLELRIDAEPLTEKPQSSVVPVVVTPRGDGGMDDLLLEVLVPSQRRPGGAS